MLPLWTQYLSRTVLGVAAPPAVPEDLSPFKAIRKTSSRVGLVRSEHPKEKKLPRQLGSRVQNNRFHQLKQVVFGKI